MKEKCVHDGYMDGDTPDIYIFSIYDLELI